MQPSGAAMTASDILARILATKAKEIAAAKALRPYIRVRADADALPAPRDFVGALRAKMRKPLALLPDQIGEDAAEHQLPESRQRRIEGGDRMVRNADDIVRKRYGGDGQRGDEKAAFASPNQAENERPENIELLLDGERP